MKHVTKLLSIFGVIGVVVLAAVAWAFWSATGSGSASGGVGNLAAPTNVTVPDSPASDPEQVGWTGVASPAGGNTDLGYWVQRYSGSTPSDACGSSHASPITAPTTSCNDTAVPAGTYTYTVTAVFRTWNATSAPSRAVTVVTDTAGPLLAVTFPVADASYNTSTWNGGCASTICGTASDADSGLASVKTSIRQGAGNYWDGASFGSTTEVLNTATGTATWSLPFPASRYPADGSYTVRVVATDNAANTTSESRTFVIDKTAPSGGSVSSLNGYSASTSPAVTFSAGTDTGSGINTAQTKLQRASATLINGVCGSFGAFGDLVTNATSPYTDAVSSGSCYQYRLVVSDNAGNVANFDSVTTTKVDATPPTLTLAKTSTNIITNGTAVLFRGGSGGSFSITAADSESGISSTNFPAAPSGWSRSTGTNSVTYTLSGATQSSTLAGVSATNNAGTNTSVTVTITVDNTGPTQAFSLTNPVNAFMSGTTIFYRSNAPGSFTLVDTVGDAGAGPASATFPAIATTGWTHNVETVATPTGGPYASSTYSWTAGATVPAAAPRTIAGTDALGNTTTTVLTFTADTTAPTTTITFPANGTRYGPTGWAAGCAPDGICGTAADATSGVSGVNITVRRLNDNHFWNGSGWQAGTFSLVAAGTTSWSQAFDAPNLSDGLQYTVTATSSDNVGNASTVATSTFTYDALAPTVTSLALANGETAGTAAVGDSVTIAYSEPMKVASFCSAWTGGDESNQNLSNNNNVVVTITDNGSNDLLTVSSNSCAFNLGQIALNGNYVSTTRTFSGNNASKSTITWTAATRTLVISLGAASGAVNVGIAANAPVYTPSASIQDSAGNAIPTNGFVGTSSRF